VILDDPQTLDEIGTCSRSNVSDFDRKSELRIDNAAYVMYTSGSTGTPKAVTITHDSVTRFLTAMEKVFQFDVADAGTLFHSVTTDITVWEMWGPLLRGARLVLVPFWISRSPGAFRTFIEREQITVLSQTPCSFYRLIESEEQSHLDT